MSDMTLSEIKEYFEDADKLDKLFLIKGNPKDGALAQRMMNLLLAKHGALPSDQIEVLAKIASGEIVKEVRGDTGEIISTVKDPSVMARAAKDLLDLSGLPSAIDRHNNPKQVDLADLSYEQEMLAIEDDLLLEFADTSNE